MSDTALLEKISACNTDCVNYLRHRCPSPTTYIFLKEDYTVIVASEDYSQIGFYNQVFNSSKINFDTSRYDDMWGMEIKFPNYDEALAFYNSI